MKKAINLIVLLSLLSTPILAKATNSGSGGGGGSCQCNCNCGGKPVKMLH